MNNTIWKGAEDLLGYPPCSKIRGNAAIPGTTGNNFILNQIQISQFLASGKE